jgi:hypothetical protein
MMSDQFGLIYETVDNAATSVNATGSKVFYYSINKKAAEFGYEPIWSSLECIASEATAIFSEFASKSSSFDD